MTIFLPMAGTTRTRDVWHGKADDFDFDTSWQKQPTTGSSSNGKVTRPQKPEGPNVDKIYAGKLAAQKRFEDSITTAISALPNLASNLRVWLMTDEAVKLLLRNQLDAYTARPGIAINVETKKQLVPESTIEFINVNRNTFLKLTLRGNHVECSLASCELTAFSEEKLKVLLDQLAEIAPCKPIAALLRTKMKNPPAC